jgi:hypothetical protein
MKILKISLLVILCLAGLAFAVFKFYKADKKEILISMDDGVSLNTSLFVPRGIGSFPTILVRTPYNKYVDEWMGQAFNMFRIAVVLQDVRGRYRSEGEYYPFINEREDGLKTLRWIREQPWSDGTVAGWGGSYLGFTQWAISDSLDFLTLLLTGANLYDFVYPDSLFSLQTAYLWGTESTANKLNKIDSARRSSAIMTLPLTAADDSAFMDIDFFNDWVIHDRYDEYWKKLDYRGKANTPVLSIAGWYDLFLKAQIRDFQALEANGGNPGHLVIGPWAHGPIGEPNTYGGTEKSGDPKQIFKFVKNFLRKNRMSLGPPFKDKRYNLFIMERNEYMGSDVWPPEETKIIPHYLGPGRSIMKMPLSPGGDLSYIYNPAEPFPSLGGTTLGTGVGPARQNPNSERSDQLIFEMPVDIEPLILLGPVSATLWLSSSAECTDFIVGIQDVYPDGKIINIQEGGAKVRFDSKKPEKKEISVWATGYQINPGHKLRVVISSSWFPRYNRSLSTCEPAADATTISEAKQTVWYGPGTPSSINLPVYDISSTTKK